MSDLSEALRAEGHDDIAAALERKSLAGELRKKGRDDLADALEAGPAPVEVPPPPTDPPAPQQPHELLAQQLDAAQSKWHTLGGASGDGPAAA